MLTALLLALVAAVLPADTGTAVFTGEDYSVYALYTKSVSPGDAVCVRIDFTPSRKTMREPAAQTQAVLLFGDERKADFFQVGGARARSGGNSAVSLLGMVPLSTWQKGGEYTVTVMYSAFGGDFMKFTLPVSVRRKDFVSETLELDSSNTAIRTDTSPERMQQIDRLNGILLGVNPEAVYQTEAFSPPTTATRLTAFFGDRRVYAYSNGKTSTSLHHGTDYGVPTGTPVLSCGRGMVALAENRVSTGWSVVVEHMPGLYSLYYHMDSLSVREGELVEQGEQIGESGATGLATGPHLHWEVRLNGESVNPDFFTGGFPFFDANP